MSDSDLAYISASRALELFARKELSPVELLQAVIARAEKVQPKVNAFTDTYFDEALAAARQAETRYAGKGARPRRLEGLPLAVKDAQRVAGKRTTQGSLIFKHHVDDHSDPMIERLQKSGAIIHARTTTPEFCLSGVCYSRLWGVTRNPHNLAFGPGGSSGGSGAALAAGMTLLATGTDIGGSIRIPASACGVVGFKPPHGRNPDGPPANFDRFNHCGPLTRSVADAALMQGVTAGPHPLDHNSLRTPVRLDVGRRDLKGMRIAWSMDFGYVPVDPDVRRNTLAALAVMANLGATIEEVDLGWTSDVERDAMHWFHTMHFGRQTIWQSKDHRDLMTNYALQFAESAITNTGIDDVHKSWERLHRMYQTLGPVLATHDVLVCPTLNLPAVAAAHDTSDPDFRVAGVRVDPEWGWCMTHQFNMLHNCPVMSVPSGKAASGVPTGIQIVGRTFDDPRVFAVAAAYEAAVGGWYRDSTSRPLLG